MSDRDSLEQHLLEYKALIDNAGVAIVLTRERLVRRCNPYAHELFGWPPGKLIGQAGSVFLPSAEAYVTLLQKVRPELRAGKTVEVESPLKRHDGSIFSAHLVVRAIDAAAPRLGTVWIINDISQECTRRDATARLLREQQLIFESAHTGIVFLRERIIVRCNPRFEEILGRIE